MYRVLEGKLAMGYKVPAGISGRHVHLTESQFETLFGKGKTLTVFKPLSQPGQFAAEEKVDVVGPRGTLTDLRVIGPFRSHHQVELCMTDCFNSGIEPVLRRSGHFEGTPGCRLIGPAGELELTDGVMVNERHLHVSAAQAEEAGLKEGQLVTIKFGGARGIIFENVIVRAGDGNELDFHIDIDEANAGCIHTGDIGEIIEL